MKMNLMFKSIITMLIFGIVLLTACSSEESQKDSDKDTNGYPEKPITWVIPDAAGGGLDTIIRTIAPYVEENMPNDAEFVLENLPGATQTIAVSEVYNAEPDGYTIGQSSVAALTIMPHLNKTSYTGYEDFELIANVFDAAHFLVVPADSPYNSFEELLEYAEKNPGKLKVGIDGTYNVQHLPIMNLQQEAGVDLNETVYESSAGTKKALLGNEIEAGILPHHTIISDYEEGTLKPLINVMEVKPDYFSDISTLKEQGFTPSQLFVGTIAPKGTPEDRLNILTEAIRKALEDPELIEALNKRETMINFNNPEEYEKRLEELNSTNKKILEELGALE